MPQQNLYPKIEKLEEILRKRGPAAIAFSGGLDSSLLLYYAAKIHPGKIVALTVRSPLLSPADDADLPKVIETLRKAGLKFQTREIIFDPLAEADVSDNSTERCYFCKKIMVRLWMAEARAAGLSQVFEGGQVDDQSAMRPGKRALREAGVSSPLAEAGFNKDDVRAASRAAGLYGPERPSQACLASRAPYGQKLTSELLTRVYETEKILGWRGFVGARARTHGNLLRLELLPEHFQRLENENGWSLFLQSLPEILEDLGWDFITLDARGYQSSCYDRLLMRTGI